MAKFRLDNELFIVDYEVFEDIRVNPLDNTEVEIILLGMVDWIQYSYNWEPASATIFVSAFISYSGSLPEFDWQTNRYKFVDDEIIVIPKE